MSEFNVRNWEGEFGDTTYAVYDKTLDFDIKEDGLGIKPLEEEFSTKKYNYKFSDKLTKTIVRAGYSGDESDISAKISFFKKNLSNIDEDISYQTIADWFTSKRYPKADEGTRKRGHKICFALDMTLEQTYDFMENVLFVRAFNFKNPTECIYYFALKNKLTWIQANELDEKIRQRRSGDYVRQELATVEIEKGLSELETENELIAYLLKNVPEEAASLKNARKEVEKLVDVALKLAKKEAEIMVGDRDTYKGMKYDGIDFLLRVIYGNHLKGNKVKSTMKKHAPALVYNNFPLALEMSKALKEESAISSDMIRKCIIMLCFYTQFASLCGYGSIRKAKTNDKNYDAFVAETQQCLEQCCLPLLHPKNPYDRIFLYSAWWHKDDEDPIVHLETFRKIIETISNEEND